MPELFNLKNFSAIQHPDSQPLQRLSDRQDDHTDSEEHGVSPVGFHTEALKSPSVSPVNEKEIEEYLSFRQKPKQVESRECQTDLSLLIDGTYEINLVNIGAHNSSIQTGSEVKTENQQR